MSAPPGWYPDPDPQAAGPPARRWWDGKAWTAALDDAFEPGPASRNWAVAAHASPIAAMIVAMAFLGPLVVYLVKRDDPFAREHAREALNFQLTVLLYAFVLVLSIIFLVGLILLPFFAVAWLVLIILAAVRAGQGEAFRYPLTIRFLS